MYAQQDANFNVTSLIGDTDAVTSGTQWGVVERDAYDAYGEPTFLDASFTALSGNVSGYEWTVLHQGTMFDANADLYHVRYRVLKDGRWAQQDPSGYSDGANLTQFVRSNPGDLVDPLGRQGQHYQPPPPLPDNPTHDQWRKATPAQRDAWARRKNDDWAKNHGHKGGYDAGNVTTPKRVRVAQAVLAGVGIGLITGGLAAGAFGTGAAAGVAEEEVATAELQLADAMQSKSYQDAITKIVAKLGPKVINVVTIGGTKYVVDGNHNVRAAIRLGIKTLRVLEVALPFRGYNSIEDVINGAVEAMGGD